MKSEICSAFLTPDFPTAAQGRVHSVFTRTANVEFAAGGEKRLLTLIPKEFPRLPDSICVQDGVLCMIEEGMSSELSEKSFLIGNTEILYIKDTSFDGRIKNLSERMDPSLISEFLSVTKDLQCGLYRLPEDYRKKVTDALRKGELNRYIGLGSGLTPSFDDACVGYTAVCCALGAPSGLAVDEKTDTTDVSLRYLKLAQNGYFGEPICRVINSLVGDDDLALSLEMLKNVGATSGLDMIFGIRIAIEELLL